MGGDQLINMILLALACCQSNRTACRTRSLIEWRNGNVFN
jgi:hypothetical protein